MALAWTFSVSFSLRKTTTLQCIHCHILQNCGKFNCVVVKTQIKLHTIFLSDNLFPKKNVFFCFQFETNCFNKFLFISMENNFYLLFVAFIMNSAQVRCLSKVQILCCVSFYSSLEVNFLILKAAKKKNARNCFRKKERKIRLRSRIRKILIKLKSVLNKIYDGSIRCFRFRCLQTGASLASTHYSFKMTHKHLCD